MSGPRDPEAQPQGDDTLDAPPGTLPTDTDYPANPGDATVLLPEQTASGRQARQRGTTRDEAPRGEDLSERLVEAAIRRGLITAKQATKVLVGRAPALESMVDSGLVSAEQAAELEEEVRNDFVPGYRLIGELGRGAMGVVYKAIQTSLDRTVAMKVVNPRQANDPQFVQRFQQEAKALARLNHPNIVQVYDHGESRGQLYIALEFVKGTDCADVLETRKTFDPGDALRVVRDAAVGLAHAHAEGIIHRDIKPANLMLADASGSGSGTATTVKVTDLGLARLQETAEQGGNITTAGTVLGSPAYMAPEQSLGEPADFRSDMYSLGATLYHLLVGKAPFAGESALAILAKKSIEQLTNPTDLVPGIASDLVLVLDRMLARERGARYASYEDLLADLDALLSGQPPRTGPVPRGESSLLPPTRVPPTRRLAEFDDGTPPPKGQAVTHQAPSALPRVAALLGVIIATCLGVWQATRGSDGADPAPSPTAGPSAPADPAADVAALVETLEQLDDRSVLEASDALAEVRAGLEALPAGQRTPLRLRVTQRLRKALEGQESRRSEGLERTWAAGDYASLATQVAAVEADYAQLDEPLPTSLSRWASLAEAAAGEAGAAERAAWAAAQAADDPREVLRLLDDFAGRFPFSPALDEAAAALAEAGRRAPAVTLTPTPADASLTVDGDELGDGRWEGRLLQGHHTIEARADGHYPTRQSLTVEGPTQVALRLDPQPRQPLRQSQRSYPVWRNRPGAEVARAWSIDGQWTAVLGGIQGESHRSGSWATARRELTQALTRSGGAEAPGWQLEWKLDPPAAGAAELHLLDGADGQRVAVGLEAGHVYLGIRRGAELEVLARWAFDEAPGYYRLDWDGDVAVLWARDQRVGSLRPDWTPAEPHLTLAVLDTQATFRDLFVFALEPAE